MPIPYSKVKRDALAICHTASETSVINDEFLGKGHIHMSGEIFVVLWEIIFANQLDSCLVIILTSHSSIPSTDTKR